jgi:fructose-1,6-bisphosphatase/inositol monophosphatase family enzyme
MIRFGGESYAVAMLAAGRIDLCLEPALQPFDIVALTPIIASGRRRHAPGRWTT